MKLLISITLRTTNIATALSFSLRPLTKGPKKTFVFRQVLGQISFWFLLFSWYTLNAWDRFAASLPQTSFQCLKWFGYECDKI